MILRIFKYFLLSTHIATCGLPNRGTDRQMLTYLQQKVSNLIPIFNNEQCFEQNITTNLHLRSVML